MNLDRAFSGLDVAASGLVAERVRMGIIATNLSHATDTNRGDGKPYRRQEVVFNSVMEGALRGGVEVADIVTDESTPLVIIHGKHGHPDADKDGNLAMPNVDTPREMIDLLTAARSYEANLEAAQSMVRMAEQALQFGR